MSAHPAVTVWPQCTAEGCETAWVLRRAISLTDGWIWAWFRDCKHKRSMAVLVNADGPVGNEREGEK